MAIEFLDVNEGSLKGFSATAPGGAIIGVVGLSDSGAVDFMQVAAGRATALNHTLTMEDAVARARTLAELDQKRSGGETIFIASHELALIELVSDEVWWFDGGRLASKGNPRETVAKYRAHAADQIRRWGSSVSPKLMPLFRRGDGRAEVLSVETLGADGLPTIVWKSGEQVSVRVTVRFQDVVENPVLGIMIRTQIGFEVYGTNTGLEGAEIGRCSAGETVTVLFAFCCELCPNAFTVTVASHDPDGTAHDWLDDAVGVTVTDNRYTAGVANLRAKVTVAR